MRHVEAKYLVIQELIKEGLLQVSHVNTHGNPADIYTKHLRPDEMAPHLESLGFIATGLGFMITKTCWAKPWKRPKMANAILVLAVVSAKLAEAVEDMEDDVFPFWKAVMIWTVC